MNISIFEDEWRDCLRAHLFHVIRERDVNNERSLITVLLQTGFSADEIAAMRAEAIAELGWSSEADQDPVLDGESPVETDTETPPEMEALAEAAVEAPVAESDALDAGEPPTPEPPTDPGEDEFSGPPVQLSLF